MKRILALAFVLAITTCLFAQNPYEIFGRSLDTDPAIVQAGDFTLTNIDTAHPVRKVIVNQQKNEVALIDKQGDTLLAQPLTPDMRLRWLTTDPAYQYFSPYLGMGNNPIRNIDPDGGNTYTIDKDGNLKHINNIGGFDYSIVHTGTWQDGAFVAENTYFFESYEGNLTAFDQHFYGNNIPGMGGGIATGQTDYIPTFELAFLPAALPFRTGSAAVDFALGVANPLGGFRSAGGAASKVKYIGRMKDLEDIPRHLTFLDDLPNKWTHLSQQDAAKYLWKQNSSVLRKALRDGYTIKDASWFRSNSQLAPIRLNPNRTVGQTFLGAERLLLQNRGLWP